MKILSIDDAPIIFKQLKYLLEDLDDIELIESAKNLDEAYNFLKSIKPDIIILDLKLKDENGLELLEFVTKNHPEIKTIILSNEGDYFYRNKCHQMGAAYFLDKSYEFDKLIDCITKIQDSNP